MNMRYLQILIVLIIITILTNCNNQEKKNDENINPKIKKYVEFLQKQNKTAKEYILTLFDKYDVVILCERAHYEFTQYDLYLDIISDKRFINKVGNVFVEVGVSSQQNKVNSFLKSENLTENEIEQKALEIYRNIPFFPEWDKTSYYDFLVRLYRLNQNLDTSKKINLYYSDVPFNWEKTRTQEQYQVFIDTLNTRDSIIAMQIINNFEKIKKTKYRDKALIIINYRHAFTNIRYTNSGVKTENVGRYLKEKYGNRLANILINDLYTDNQGNFHSYQNGKWDASFEILKKMNIGFNFNNSPFGKDSFDMYPVKNTLTYKDVFTGFIYTSPIDSFIFKKGVKNYITKDFEKEYIRRSNLAGYKPEVKNDTIQRMWKYNNKEWCPNYDTVKREINKWKKNTL